MKILFRGKILCPDEAKSGKTSHILTQKILFSMIIDYKRL